MSDELDIVATQAFAEGFADGLSGASPDELLANVILRALWQCDITPEQQLKGLERALELLKITFAELN
jgi:hypothetical protein